MSRLVALSLALSVSLAGAWAQAESSESDAAIAHGVALRRERKDAEALAEFRRAYALDPTPRALAQIGLAEAALEQWVTAENDLLRVLAASDAWVERQRSALRIALEEVEGHLGTLVLTSADGSEVWIDSAFAARLPVAAIRVPAHHVVIEVRAAGFTTARRELDVTPATTVHESIVLEPAPAPPPEGSGGSVSRDTPPAAPPTASSAAGERETSRAPAAAPPRSLLMPLVFGGVSAAGFITGAYFGVRAMNSSSEYAQQCAGGCTNLSPARFDTVNKIHDDAQTSGTAATIAFVVGGASLATGVAWWLVDRARASRPTARIVPIVGRDVNGVLVEGEL